MQKSQRVSSHVFTSSVPSGVPSEKTFCPNNIRIENTAPSSDARARSTQLVKSRLFSSLAMPPLYFRCLLQQSLQAPCLCRWRGIAKSREEITACSCAWSEFRQIQQNPQTSSALPKIAAGINRKGLTDPTCLHDDKSPTALSEVSRENPVLAPGGGPCKRSISSVPPSAAR